MGPMRNRGGGAVFAGRRGRRPYGWECPAQNRDGPGKGTAARAGHAPPLRKGQCFSQTENPAANNRPAPRRRAGIKSEKAGFRLKNRLIVIFEVKFGFFLPLWGSRGAGLPGRGPRLAGSRLPSGLRRTALAVAGGACIWRSPVSLRSTVAPRAKPRITSEQRDFSGTLLVTKEYKGHGNLPFPYHPHVLTLAHTFFFPKKRGREPFRPSAPPILTAAPHPAAAAPLRHKSPPAPAAAASG